MLTLIPINALQNEACITVTDSMTPEDRGRLASLAEALRGRRLADPERYLFTELRGRKAWLLFSNGFQGVPTLRRSYTNERCITHSKHGKRMLLSEAVNLARIMEPVAVMEEEA